MAAFGIISFVVSLALAFVVPIDAAKYPSWAFDQAGGESKTTWTWGPVISLFCCWPVTLGLTIVWFARKRSAVIEAARQQHVPQQIWQR